MRTAYKVWAWIAAGVFCVVAVTDLSSQSPAKTTASTAPSYTTSTTPTVAPAALTGMVSQVQSPANLLLVDGRQVHVTMLNGMVGSYGTQAACEEAADQALAQSLLAGKTVTLRQAADNDADGIAPPGYVQADVWLPDGRGYADTINALHYENRDKTCPTPTPAPVPTTDSGSSSSSGGGIDVDVHHGHGLPDGTFTGGYCRHKWWC